MTQELSPSPAPPRPEAPPAPPAPDDAPPRGRLERWAQRLVPRTRKHQALYAFLFLLFLIAVFEWRSSTSYSAIVIVTPLEDRTVGIGGHTGELFDFGELPQGGSARVALILENDGQVPTRFFIVPVGNIRQFIKLDEAFILLQPGEAQVVEVAAVVPRTASLGEYSGRVVVIRSPWPPWP